VEDFWGRLTVPEQTALATVASPSRFQADSTILLEHDAGDHVLVIRSGLAKVYARVGADREVLLALRRPGDIIGEMAGTAGGRRSATVVAIDTVDALLIKADRFAAFLGQFTHASTVLNSVLVDRLRYCDSCRVAAATLSAGQRLARLLLWLGDEFGEPTGDGGRKIALGLSQDDLGAFVGASQRAVAREMKKWRRRGIVATGRRWVTVRQPDGLRRIAGPGAPPP